jgi:uncharacterized protein (TIRG00374 family)
LLALLALCAIGAIVAYWFWGRDFNWDLFLSSLSGLNGGWLFASVILTLSTYGFRARRWQILLNPLKRIGLVPLFWLTLVGFAAIYGLGRAAELARPLWLTRREGVALSGSLATIVVERFLDSILLVALFGLALIAVEVPAESAGSLGLLKNTAWIVAGAAIAAMVGLFLVRAQAAAISRFIPFRRLASWFDSFAQGLSFLQNGKSLGGVLLQSVLLWITVALQFWFVLRGMNIHLPLGASTVVMVGAAIGSLAQIPGIGGGFQAGYIFCMTTFFQIPLEQAVATSLITTVFSYGPTIAIAGLYMIFQGISLTELKTTIQKPESL